MHYKKIMNVCFTIRDEKRGCIVIGDLDDEFPINNLDITGSNVLIKNSTEEFIFQVKEVDLSTSIIGKVNIGLTLFDSVYFDKIVPGSEVFKCLG